MTSRGASGAIDCTILVLQFVLGLGLIRAYCALFIRWMGHRSMSLVLAIPVPKDWVGYIQEHMKVGKKSGMGSKPRFCGKDQCLWQEDSLWACGTKGQLPGEEGLGWALKKVHSRRKVLHWGRV